MVHSNSDFVHLCLSLLARLRDDRLRKVFIEEVIRMVAKTVEGKMSVDTYSGYLFYKVLGEMYSAGMKAGHAAIGVESFMPGATSRTGKPLGKVKANNLSSTEKLALEVAPFIKALREMEFNTSDGIANKLNELNRPSIGGGRWDGKLVEKIENIILKIEARDKRVYKVNVRSIN